MRRQSLREWIRSHRQEIDATIKKVCGSQVRINDEERRLWVLNDEGLYWWAKGEGVNI